MDKELINEEIKLQSVILDGKRIIYLKDLKEILNPLFDELNYLNFKNNQKMKDICILEKINLKNYSIAKYLLDKYNLKSEDILKEVK